MTLKRFTVTSGSLTIVLGATVLLGWVSGNASLTGIGLGQTAMKANTAFSVCLLGVAVLLRQAGAARASAVAGLIVLLVGGFTLLEHLARAGRGIDELVFVDPNRAEAGRMGINTAIAFCLLGTGFLFLQSGRRRQTFVVHACAIGSLAIAALAAMGYVTGVASLYGPASYTAMALSTAIALIVISLALLASCPAYGIPAAVLASTPGGRVARSLLPLAVLPVALYALRSRAVEARLVSADVGNWLVATVVVASIALVAVLAARAVDRADEVRARLEEQLLETQKLESLGVLAGGIAHNFNNLLLAILGNASLALDKLPADSRARSSIEQIEIAGSRAEGLARDILAFSGKAVSAVEQVDLRGLIEETGRLVSAGTEASIEIDCLLEEGLPSILADASQIRQVTMSLVANAVEALGEEGGTIEVRADRVDAVPHANFRFSERLRGGPYVRLEVKDSGIGMDTKTLERLFEPFFTTKFTGRGLGLAAVLGIVRAHHGAIDVTSELGEGTVATVLLPCASAAASVRTGSLPTPRSETTVDRESARSRMA